MVCPQEPTSHSPGGALTGRTSCLWQSVCNENFEMDGSGLVNDSIDYRKLFEETNEKLQTLKSLSATGM